MMESLSTTAFSSKQLCLNPSNVLLFNRRYDLGNMISLKRECDVGFCFLGKYVKGRIYTANSKRIYPISNREGQWEDPDDGSGSEEDDEEEDMVEENDLDFESDWETESGGGGGKIIADSVNKLSVNNNDYEEDLTAEIEQLLSPEERVIFDRHENPVLEKISTAKWNPLHTFALAGQIKFMDKLLENGVYVDEADKDGLTALHHATIGKKEPVISHLLRKGANPQPRDLDGATPLHYAVQVGAMQTVKLLLKYNVDVNIADNEGWTSLHIAIQSRNRDIAKILLVSGADQTRKNKNGKTPLDLSLAYGKEFKSYDLARLLKTVPAYREL